MSAEQNSDQRSVRGSTSAGFWRLALLSAFVIASLEHLFVTCVWSVPPNLGDEGVAALDALRILGGQSPHGDFFEIIPPVSFVPTSVLFVLFGVSSLPMRLLTLLYGAALIALVDRVLARFAGGMYRLTAASALVVLGVSAWPMPSHHWLADLLQIGAVYAMVRAWEGERPGGWAILSGALVALAGFALQDQGIYFLIAMLAFVLFWGGSQRRRWLLSFSFGLGVTGVLILAALWARAPLGNLLYEWVTFPLTRYNQINPGGLLEGWQHFFGKDFAYELQSEPVYFVTSIALHFLVALAPLALLPIGLSWWRDKGRTPLTGLLLAGVVAFYATCLHRWALANLIWAFPAALLSIGWILSSQRDPGRNTTRPIRVGLLLVVVLCWVNAFAAQWALLHPSLEKIQTAVGTYCLPQKKTGEAQRIRNAVDAIRRIVPEGEPVFTRGYVPALAYYAGRTPLSRYNFYLSGGYHTEAQGEEIRKLLLSRRQSYIIASKPILPDLSFDRWLLQNAQPLWMNDLIVIFRLTGSSEPKEGVERLSP